MLHTKIISIFLIYVSGVCGIVSFLMFITLLQHDINDTKKLKIIFIENTEKLKVTCLFSFVFSIHLFAYATLVCTFNKFFTWVILS